MIYVGQVFKKKSLSISDHFKPSEHTFLFANILKLNCIFYLACMRICSIQFFSAKVTKKAFFVENETFSRRNDSLFLVNFSATRKTFLRVIVDNPANDLINKIITC